MLYFFGHCAAVCKMQLEFEVSTVVERKYMARDSEFQRERKKKQLRQSMVTNDKVRSAPVSWAEDHRRTVNVAGIVVAVLVLAVVLAWFVAERLWRLQNI